MVVGLPISGVYLEREKYFSQNNNETVKIIFMLRRDNMKNILVTGAAGFIGFHLAESLSKTPAKITIIDNLSRGKSDTVFENLISKGNVRYIQADMTATDYYAQLDNSYDEIYHLAAVNGTKYFYEKPQEVLRVNILSLMHLLEWINADRCGKFLFTSSSEAYAGTIRAFPNAEKMLVPTKEDVPLCIDDVFNERYSYGGSKLAGELLTINYLRARKVPFSIVRYHNVYGPRMGVEHVIPEFCRRIYNKQNPFDIFGGDDTRAFCYIADAVAGTMQVMKSDSASGQIVHIGNSSEEIKIEELAKKIIHIANLDVKLNVQPSRAGSVSRRCPDIQKIKDLTGYSPKTLLDEGLKLTLEWYLDFFKGMG
jgi:nucleoside-diphosphate-sugar epimerase